MEINLASYVVRSDDGSIDHEQTLHKFMQDLIAFESASADEFELIREAVNSVFDRHDNKRMPKPLVVGEAFQYLLGKGVSFTQFGEFSKKIADYLGDKTRFHAQRGQNGGVERIAR